MEFTFNSDQLLAGVMFVFIIGSAFGAWWEKNHSGIKEDLESLEDEIEVLQQEILRSEKDKDYLRELLYDLSSHPAIPHLAKDRAKARRRIKAVK